MRRIVFFGAALILVVLVIAGALISTGVVGAGSASATLRSIVLFFGDGGSSQPVGSGPHSWTAGERGLIASLSIDRLPPLPPDPSNSFGDDADAVALGHALFFDSGLSPDGTVSCSTCHVPENYFTDGKVRANVRGVDTPRHTPTIVGIAFSDWFYWDGRKDSQWHGTGAAETAMNWRCRRRTPAMSGEFRSQYDRFRPRLTLRCGPLSPWRRAARR